MITQIPDYIHCYTAFRHFPKSSLLYFLLRSADDLGSGQVTFDVNLLAQACDRLRPTINTWIRDCCQNGLFRYCEWITRSKVIIYYTNLDDVALSHGIDDIGESTLVPLEVYRSSLHVWTSEVQAMSLQQQSYHEMVKEQAKKQQRIHPRVNTHADIFQAKPQTLHTLDFSQTLSNEGAQRTGKESVILLGDRCVFVGPNFTPWGGSQETIAKRSGLTPRTIQRHFSAAYRESKGLSDLEKYQLAMAVGNSTPQRVLTRSGQVDDEDYKYLNRLFTVGRGDHRVEFLACTNLYNSEVNFRFSDRRSTKIKTKAMKIVKNKLSIPTLKPITPIYLSSLNTPA